MSQRLTLSLMDHNCFALQAILGGNLAASSRSSNRFMAAVELAPEPRYTQLPLVRPSLAPVDVFNRINSHQLL